MADERTPRTVKKWAYPFPAADGKEIQDPQKLLDALSLAEDGSYPIGANGLWHGGVHFDANTGAVLKQTEGVRCIADGEIVAYRIDREYPVVEYPSDGRKAMYSTGFTLIRHRLEIPAASSPAVVNATASDADTTSPTPTTTAATTASQPALVFFSLYMHLRHWADYVENAALKRPPYWKVGDRFIVSGRAKDVEADLAPGKRGARIRNAKHAPVGLVESGAEIRLGSVHPSRKGYFELAEVLSGEVARPDDELGYVSLTDLDPQREPDPGAIGAVCVLPNPVAIDAGQLVGYLGEYQRHQDATPLPPEPKRPLLHLEVFTCDDLATFMTKSRARAAELPASQKNLLHVLAGTTLCMPSPTDLTLPAGTEIRRVERSTAKGPWVKVEVLARRIVPRRELSDYEANGSRPDTYSYEGQTVRFTGRFFGASEDFSTTSASEAKRRNYFRREIECAVGEPVWIVHDQIESNEARNAWSQFPLSISNPSGRIARHARLVSRAQLSGLPAARKAKDEEGSSWWLIDVGDTHGVDRQGWVCEKDHPNTAWKSPWDWAGFQTISETSQPADFLAKVITDNNLSAETETQKNLKVRADGVDGGPLLATLKQAIDAQGNKDRKIASDELKKALRQPWLADTLTKLIVCYESEWGGDMGKWDALDPLMVDGESDWKLEKERINRISIERKIMSRLCITEQIFHFHSVALIASFKQLLPTVTADMLKIVFNGATVDPFDLEAFAREINCDSGRYKLDTKLRLTHFFAQVREEAGANATTVENFNYSPKGLIDTFSYFRKNPEEAYLYGRTKDHDANQTAIANRAYSNREGHGAVALGEGWSYKGRGLKQLTWKSNYEIFQIWHDKFWPQEQVNFVVNPDLIAEAKYAVRSAIFFWLNHELYDIADLGPDHRYVNKITSVINKYTASYQERRSHFDRLWDGNCFNNFS